MTPSNDLLIKTMANLLREGATMLDISCPNCDNILFKLKDGNMFCPNCKQYVVREEDIKEKSENNDVNSIKTQVESPDTHKNFNFERKIIKNKISNLIKELESEDSDVKMELLVNMIDRLVEIYNKMPI